MTNTQWGQRYDSLPKSYQDTLYGVMQNGPAAFEAVMIVMGEGTDAQWVRLVNAIGQQIDEQQGWTNV